MAHLYQEDEVSIRPLFQAFHLNDSLTRIFFQIESVDMLFMRNESSGMYEAVGLIEFRAYPSYENLSVIDSAEAELLFQKQDQENEIINDFIDLNLPFGESYVVEATCTDYNRNRKFRQVIEVKKEAEFDRQNFYLSDTNGQVIFPGNQIRVGESFIIHHSSEEENEMMVRYYNRDFPIALPPYSVSNPKPFEFKADTMLTWVTETPMRLEKEGFYHMQEDTANYFGFSLFAFPNHFPLLTTYDELRGPLRYLTTNREFNEIETAVNPKLAIDRFWLTLAGGSEDRARTLLRTYYERVEAANQHFTSYIEGWKTDRGMIYCVFGPPNIIYRSSGGESWVYGQESSGLSYTFNFSKVSNPFSSNDYLLNRSSIYRYTWGQAIETWRQGRVYNVNVIRREQDRQFRQNDPSMFWY